MICGIVLFLCHLGSFVDGFVEPRVITKTKHLANGTSSISGIDNKGLESDEADGKEFPMKNLANDEMEDVNLNKTAADDENGKVTVKIDAGNAKIAATCVQI